MRVNFDLVNSMSGSFRLETAFKKIPRSLIGKFNGKLVSKVVATTRLFDPAIVDCSAPFLKRKLGLMVEKCFKWSSVFFDNFINAFQCVEFVSSASKKYRWFSRSPALNGFSTESAFM